MRKSEWVRMVGKSIYLSLYDFVPFQIGYHQSRDKIIPTHILDHVWKKKVWWKRFFLMNFFLSSRNKQIKCLHTALTLYFLQKRLVNLFSHSWLVHKSVQWTEFRAIQLTLHSLERHTQKMPWEIILPLLSLPKLRSTKIIEKNLLTCFSMPSLFANSY